MNIGYHMECLMGAVMDVVGDHIACLSDEERTSIVVDRQWCNAMLERVSGMIDYHNIVIRIKNRPWAMSVDMDDNDGGITRVVVDAAHIEDVAFKELASYEDVRPSLIADIDSIGI